ncbi:MAG TPA: glutathione S-transferase family protein [Xanthobacteraceae bacterium]|jgi:glutathione S-transferase|nr:MAG: glutathione S-transferase [Azorhizobium sp. 12-66-6]HQS07483.1 glutathione S-transferase family protein [Xanthobacteraceae bacterium]
MKLYWAPHTRAFRALWLLEEAGLPYERQLVSLDGPFIASAEFRAINPMMKVPALEDGEARIAESGAICLYVAEKAPDAHLAPAIGDPRRARYLQWLFWDAACMEAAFTQKLAGVNLPSRAAGWGSFERVMDVLEAALAPGPYLLGEQFTAADVMVGSNVWYGLTLLKVIEPRPVFTAYVARCEARPAFQRANAIEAEALAA